ncbi:MAG: hypothetical protein HY293_03605 [Planctomycetes bacterium]|nr:hypothetical protein [Planctomycetota bacterium]
MNHKAIFRSVFVVAVALGLVSVAVRAPKDPAADLPPALRKGPVDPVSRPLAAYKVYEEGIVGGIDYRGAGYSARVAESGFRFGSKEVTIEMGAPRIEQGGLSLECARGSFARDAFGVSSLDRGAVREGYYFENRRVEQTFTFPTALAQGALTLRIPVKTDLEGPVVAHSPTEPGFKEMQFLKGGLAFCDAKGATKIAYHSAIAVDAQSRQIALAPRFESGEIVLEVPAAFMAAAAYPVVIDPWLELGGSGTGGGISNTLQVSDRPSIAQTGSGNPFIAWADNLVGNYEIYVKYWNGFEFKDLGGASFGTGLSHNSGKSVNPSIATAGNGVPYVAWQDDTDGRVGVFFRRWNGTNWESLVGPGTLDSASAGGLSTTFTGPALYPRVKVISSFVNNTTLPRFEDAPLIVWEEAGEIQCFWHYAGDDQAIPGVTGWYRLGPISFAGAAGVAGSPSIAVDSLGRPVVAWHDTATGSYEIYLRRLEDQGLNGSAATPISLTGRPGGLTQNLVQLNPVRLFDNVACVGVNGSDAGSGISATPAQISQYPSVATDGTNISVAWQETLPGGATGTNNEIYLVRNTAGAWGGRGGSNAGGGISASLGNSSAPAVAAVNGIINVAWVDDSGGNPEIYLRRFVDPGSAQWEQLGVQGSAFPLIGADTIAPQGGISLTPTLSLSPQLDVDTFGNPTVIWADGTAGSLDVLMKQFSPNGPGFMTGVVFTTDLRQTLADPVLVPATLDIGVGEVTPQSIVFLSASMFTEPLNPAGSTLRLQVEVQEASTAFTGTPSAESLTVAPGARAVVPFSGLPNRNYKWQARSIDQFGRFSPYIPFGTISNVSFQINSASTGGVPGGGGPANNTGLLTRSKGSCGLTGLEVIALLGALRLLRRRKSK